MSRAELFCVKITNGLCWVNKTLLGRMKQAWKHVQVKKHNWPKNLVGRCACWTTRDRLTYKF